MIERVMAQAVAGGPRERVPDAPARIQEAARQFESLLLGQILKSMRESGPTGWLGSGEDQAGATATELAEEQFAQALAKQGGLGLATLVAAGFNKSADERE